MRGEGNSEEREKGLEDRGEWRRNKRMRGEAGRREKEEAMRG